MLRNAVGGGGGGVSFPEKSVTEVIRFNVSSVTRGWVPGWGSNSLKKALRNT